MTDLSAVMAQAGNIMLLGMGIVFCFLTVLIFCVNGMSAVVHRYFPDAPTPMATKRGAPAGASSAPAVVAAAAAAVQMHRNRNRS